MTVSFVVTAPEVVTAAAENLAGIGSHLGEAAAAAAGPTTGLVSAASDEVSLAISRLFGTYGQEFQALSAQAAAFHDEFVSLLNGGAAAYLSTELANAGQTLATAVNTPAQTLLAQLSTGAAAAAAPSGAYPLLFANTATNLQALFNAWAASPFPVLDAFGGNLLVYSQEIAYAVRSAVANFPANLGNMPAAIQSGIQGLLTFPYAYYTQQLVSAQLAFTQSFFNYLNSAARGLVAGLPTFASGLNTAIHTFLAGDYFGAVGQVGTAFAQLFITGFDVSNFTVGLNIDVGTGTVDIAGAAFPVPLGPLPDFFNAIGVIAQDAQYLTNLMPPSIPRQISQNLTNVFKTISDPSIVAIATLEVKPFVPSATGTLSGFFGLPIVFSYAALGPVITGLYGFATVAASVNDALGAGNYLGVLGTLIDSPAVITNAVLNGQVIQDIPIPIPTGVQPPFAPIVPTEILVNVHVPVDGLLVPPHFATATVSTNSSIVIPGLPFEATIFGTPFSGFVPLLVNYVPQQLAQAIRLPG